MLPAIIGAGLSAASNIGGTILHNKAQQKLYDKQYQDNISFWNMQNEYNTPAAQMQRFKDAGLNPKLIYGQGNSGNAGSIKSPDKPQLDYTGVTQSFGNIMNVAAQKAQIDLVKEQTKVAKQNALINLYKANSDGMDWRMKKELGIEAFEALRSQYEGIQADTYGKELDNTIKRESSTAMVKLRKLAVKDQELKNLINQFEVELNKAGITKSDDVMVRELLRGLDLRGGGTAKHGLNAIIRLLQQIR